MRLRSRGWLLGIVMVGLGIAAQQPAPIERAYPATLERWPQVGLDVTVMDRNDEPAKGLSFEQLVVKDNGKAVTTGTLTAAAEPQSVCLLVDTSGSTYQDQAAIKAEVLAFAQNLPPGDEMCAVDFSVKAYLDLPLTSDKSKMTDWLKFIKSSGGTALLDTVNATLDILKKGRYRSRAIVLISDGGENASQFPEKQLMQKLREPGAPTIYALVNEEHPIAAAAREPKLLGNLLEATGGLEFPIKRAADEQAAVQRLVRAMEGRYRLVYTAPDTALDGSTHRIEVELNKDLRKQKMNIAVAREYDAVGR